MRTIFALAWLVSLAACAGDAADPEPAGVAAASAAAQVEPSFDCAAASTDVERMICADAELRALDRGIAVFHKSALDGEYRELAEGKHREWLAERDACATPRCLRDSMVGHLWSLPAGDDVPTYESRKVNGTLRIIQLGQDWYAFSALALYHQGPEAVHDAGASGAFRLENGRGEVVATDHDPCRFTLTRLSGDRWRIEEHRPPSGIACAGLNATVEGVYSRVRS